MAVPPDPSAAHCHWDTLLHEKAQADDGVCWQSVMGLPLESQGFLLGSRPDNKLTGSKTLSTWHLLPPARMDQLKLTKQRAFPSPPITHLRGLQRRGTGIAHLLPLGESPAALSRQNMCQLPRHPSQGPKCHPSLSELLFGFS